MQYAEAFRALGYDIRAPRTDWSAERPNGICLSLWSQELKFAAGVCSYDTERDAGPIENWNQKPGFSRRNRHLARAFTEFGGAVDVVLVSGTTGDRYEDAAPWKPEERRGARWFVTAFDGETGHFQAETRTV